MSILSLTACIGILFVVAQGIQLFNRSCRQRFGHGLLTARALWPALIGLNLIWWGYYFWVTAPLHHTPSSAGIVLMVTGGAIAAWLTYGNIRDTDILHGLCGTLLQFVLFFPVALYGIPMLLIAMLFVLFAAYKGAPVWFFEP